MAIYGLLGVHAGARQKRRSHSPSTCSSTARRPAGTRSRAAAMTAPDPIVISAPATAGANQVRLVKRDGRHASYWSAAAVYYDTATADARQGSRQLAITRKYALLTPVKVKDRIVYRETRVHRDGESRRRVDGAADRGRIARVALSRARRSAARRCRGDPGHHRVSARARRRRNRGGMDRASSIAMRRRSSSRRSFDRGRYEFAYLVKVIAPGQFRAVPAQISPMYVPGVHASSEPQTFTITVPAGSSR